jgi:peptidoglycan/LPS O-acetylase OafA/YrhL
VKSKTPRCDSNIAEFDGLRGVMAWWVVLGHMAQVAGYDGTQNNVSWPMAILQRGGIPVDVFITLSGFVIFSLLSRTADFQYRPYLVARFCRLYPAYLVALVLALLTTPLAITAHGAPWADPLAAADALARIAATAEHRPEHVLLHLTLLHGLVADQWLPYAGDALLSPAWSLSLEWQFYLVAPGLFLLMRKHLLWWAVACAAVLVLKWWLINNPLTFSYGAFLPVKFEFFVLGMGSCMVWQRAVRQTSARAAARPLMALVVGIVAAFAIMFFTGGMREHFFSLSIWLVVFSAVLARTVLGKTTAVSKVLQHPVLQHIGQVSYSTYIIHMVLIFAVGAVLAQLMEHQAVDRLVVLTMMLALACPAVWWASLALNRWVEKPGMRLGKQWASRVGRAERPRLV